MPSGRAVIVPHVISIIQQVEPESILDVGTGFGKWGYLFREYTDIWLSAADPNRYFKGNWKIRIDGIEVFNRYLHPGHQFIYDRMYEGDVREVLPRLGQYDVIFLGDIIEHLRLDEGKIILALARKHATKCVVLSTPRFETGQGAACGNEYERHRSLWTKADFRENGPCRILLPDRATYVVVFPTNSLAHLHLEDEISVLDPVINLLRRVKRRMLRCRTIFS